MKTLASKTIKLWLNKLKLNKPQNYLNKHTISIGITTFFILTILFYFLKPIYFDYQGNKKLFENNHPDRSFLQEESSENQLLQSYFAKMCKKYQLLIKNFH